MRYLIIIVLFVLTSCQKKEERNNIIVVNENEMNKRTPNFLKINYSVKYNYRDSMAKHINPNKKYQYWQYAAYHHGMDNKIRHTILKQGGDLSLRKKINEKFSPPYSVGIFHGGHPSFRCNYVSTIDNEKINYLKSEEEFRDFLGTIDNLEEAMLLAYTYGYQLDNDIRGSEYRKVENGYELHLMKFNDNPTYKESVEIRINKNGYIKTKSLGIYCEGRDCY
jgi:hypothetical protein